MRFAAAVTVLFAAAVCAVVSGAASAGSAFAGVDGQAHNPFAESSNTAAVRARVFLFVRTDCPITNRYAPELQRLSQEFAAKGVGFWLVYPDPAATTQSIKDHIAQYSFPGTAVRDPRHELVKRAHVTIAPEAAVFDAAGRLVYHGRIDDQWVNPGKARPAATTHDLADAISATLAGRPPEQSETHAVGCWLADIQ
jgi:hypothetical protein